ncbi:MAG: hypothetical protein A3J97_10950 [Spirochaetes bacterium RIFOXYC1_FULL_54_7]|nr:MAG: hypothetical protein A3J97_10950 [Spirochaetes bacterium RIFOXYC1_FULL_54_7]
MVDPGFLMTFPEVLEECHATRTKSLTSIWDTIAYERLRKRKTAKKLDLPGFHYENCHRYGLFVAFAG